MARKIEVEITGDSRGLKAAFDESGRAVQGFNQKLMGTTAQLRNLGRTGGARYWRQVATGALGGGAAVFGLSRALQGAAEASNQLSGETSRATETLSQMSAVVSSMVSLDVAGFIEAFASGFRNSEKETAAYTATLDTTAKVNAAFALAAQQTADHLWSQAAATREAAEAARLAVTAIEAIDFANRQFNLTLVDGIEQLVAFKGAHDAAFAGSGALYAPQYGATTTAQGRPTLKPMSPSQRRELDLLTQEGAKRLPGLNDRLRQLNAQMADFNGNQAQRLALATRIANTEAEITDIYQAQAKAREAARKEAEAEAKAAAARAKAAREAARAAEIAREAGILAGPIPTPANLRRQFAQIKGRVAAGEDLPSKIVERFAGVARLLKEKIHPETREAIRDFFRMVRGEFDKGTDLKPVAVAGLNTNRIVRGLGLSAVESRALRGRLAGYTTGGQAIAGDVYLDGDKVGRSVKRFGQRDSVRSPKQKRGPNAGR